MRRRTNSTRMGVRGCHRERCPLGDDTLADCDVAEDGTVGVCSVGSMGDMAFAGVVWVRGLVGVPVGINASDVGGTAER